MVSGKGINLFSGFRRSISRCRYEKRRYWDRANNALYAQIDRLDIDRGLCRFFELNVRRSKIKDCRAMYTPWIERKKRKREREEETSHISFVLYLYYVRWIPGIVRGLRRSWHLGVPFVSWMISLVWDTFVAISRTMVGLPVHGRQYRNLISPRRGLMKKTRGPASSVAIICPIPCEIFSTICRLKLCVSLSVYNLASSRISRFVIWHSRGSNISSVLSNFKDFANI